MTVPTSNDGSSFGSSLNKKSRNHNFGDRLKAHREKMGMTQADLASKIGVDPNTIQRYESGSLPKGDKIVSLADVLDCSIDWLLKGSGQKYENKQENTQHQVSDEEQPYPDKNATILHHIEIVKMFNDPEMAKVANMELLNIERADPTAFREVVAYIKGISNGIRMTAHRRYSAPDRRVEERRKEDQFIVGNRRRGPDRRKAGGG